MHEAIVEAIWPILQPFSLAFFIKEAIIECRQPHWKVLKPQYYSFNEDDEIQTFKARIRELE